MIQEWIPVRRGKLFLVFHIIGRSPGSPKTPTGIIRTAGPYADEATALDMAERYARDFAVRVKEPVGRHEQSRLARSEIQRLGDTPLDERFCWYVSWKGENA